jgi:predicted secreted protein
MTFSMAFFIYLLIWWTLLFAVLPLGVERQAEEGRGFDSGAPRDPKLKQKLLINTVLSAAVLAVIWVLVDAGIIRWGEWFNGG